MHLPPKGGDPNEGAGVPKAFDWGDPKLGLPKPLAPPLPWEAREPNVGEAALAKLERKNY